MTTEYQCQSSGNGEGKRQCSVLNFGHFVDNGGGLSTGAIIGIVVVVCFIILVAILMVVCWIKKKQQPADQPPANELQNI